MLSLKIKLRIALLCLLASSALFMAAQALESLREQRIIPVPEKIYASFSAQRENAEFFLREKDGYIAVYGKSGVRTPLEITEIETAILRKADRAMLEKGIPVKDRSQLLRLLEDLGS